MHLTRLTRNWAVIGLTLLLAACAGPPLRAYTEHPELAASVATTDEKEQRRRFGHFVDMVGKSFVTVHDEKAYIVNYSWVIPGAVIREVSRCVGKNCVDGTYHIQWDKDTRNLFHLMGARQADGTYQTGRTMTVQSNGEIHFQPAFYIRYERANNSMVMGGAVNSIVSKGYTPEEAERAYEVAIDSARAARRESRDQMHAFLGALNSGLSVAAQDQAVMNQRRTQLQSGVNQAIASAPRPSASTSTAQTGTNLPGASSGSTQQPRAQTSAPASSPTTRVASGTPSAASRAQQEPAAKAPPATKSLRFVVAMSMRPGTQAKNNPNCYSNVITVPGPAGYGSKDWSFSREANNKALEIIKTYYPQIQQKCAAAVDGKVRAGTYGSPSYDVNFSGKETLMGPRVPEDVLVQINP